MIIFPLDVPFKVVNEHTSHYNSSQTLYKDIPFRRDVRAWSSLSCPFSSENDRYRQKPQRFLEGKHLSFRQYFATFSGFRTIGLRVAFWNLAPHLALGRYRYCRTRQGGFTLCHGPTACKGWLLYWWRTGGKKMGQTMVTTSVGIWDIWGADCSYFAVPADCMRIQTGHNTQ
jgi:hypothetical protein